MEELKKEIKDYKKNYINEDFKHKFFHKITKHIDYCFLEAIIVSKKYKFYKENNKNIINKFKMIYYGYLNNKNVFKYGIEIRGRVGKKLRIYHSNIVINNNAILGDNVKLHGNNCIGNNGISEDAPIIGDNVDIGFGAIIIGGIKIANNINIGAGAVVNKNFLEEGITIAGVPAVQK